MQYLYTVHWFLEKNFEGVPIVIIKQETKDPCQCDPSEGDNATSMMLLDSAVVAQQQQQLYGTSPGSDYGDGRFPSHMTDPRLSPQHQPNVTYSRMNNPNNMTQFDINANNSYAQPASQPNVQLNMPAQVGSVYASQSPIAMYGPSYSGPPSPTTMYARPPSPSHMYSRPIARPPSPSGMYGGAVPGPPSPNSAYRAARSSPSGRYGMPGAASPTNMYRPPSPNMPYEAPTSGPPSPGGIYAPSSPSDGYRSTALRSPSPGTLYMPPSYQPGMPSPGSNHHSPEVQYREAPQFTTMLPPASQDPPTSCGDENLLQCVTVGCSSVKLE